MALFLNCTSLFLKVDWHACTWSLLVTFLDSLRSQSAYTAKITIPSRQHNVTMKIRPGIFSHKALKNVQYKTGLTLYVYLIWWNKLKWKHKNAEKISVMSDIKIFVRRKISFTCIKTASQPPVSILISSVWQLHVVSLLSCQPKENQIRLAYMHNRLLVSLRNKLKIKFFHTSYT